MAGQRNHYDILNVSPDAEPVVIEAAYRALMKKYHPDQAEPAASAGPSAADINQAYAVLRDADRRAAYDHRERTRQKAVQIAQHYQPPPPQRLSRVFGWGGWVVALILGGVLLVFAERAQDVAAARAKAARAAAMVVPDFSSQPKLPEDSVVTPAAVAEVRAEALGVKAPSVRPRPPAASEGAKPVRAAAAQARAPRPPAAPRTRRQGREKDFLEREGYIY
jgi:hypothetical protein